MEPLVTIGIPNYNSGSFLKEACESILKQSYKNYEVIVTDDNSTDESFDLAREIADERFVFIPSSRRRGPQAQRNHQISQAKGKYFCVFDADDTWHSHKIQSQVAFMEQSTNVFALGTAINVGVIPFGPANAVFKKSSQDEILKTQLFWETPIWNNSLMFRTRIARSHNLKYIEGEWAEDQTFLLSAARAGLKFSNLQDNLTFYRSHQGQMTTNSARLNESAFRLRREHLLHYFPNLTWKEVELILLDSCSSATSTSLSKNYYLNKIQSFRKLRFLCLKTNNTYSYSKELSQRCETTIWLLINNNSLSSKDRAYLLLKNLDVMVNLIKKKRFN